MPQAWPAESGNMHPTMATGPQETGHLEKPPGSLDPLASCSVMWKYACVSVISVVTKVSSNSSNYILNVMTTSLKNDCTKLILFLIHFCKLCSALETCTLYHVLPAQRAFLNDC